MFQTKYNRDKIEIGYLTYLVKKGRRRITFVVNINITHSQHFDVINVSAAQILVSGRKLNKQLINGNCSDLNLNKIFYTVLISS